MSNSYYTPTGTPGYGTAGASSPIRSEYVAIAAGFALLPALGIGVANQFVIVNAGGNALVSSNQALPGAGSATAPSYSFNTDNETGVYQSATGYIDFTIEGVQYADFAVGGATFYANENSTFVLGAINSSVGASAGSIVEAVSNNVALEMQAYSSGPAYLYASGSGLANLSIGTLTNTGLIFVVNNTNVARFAPTTGNLLLGTTTDAGAGYIINAHGTIVSNTTGNAPGSSGANGLMYSGNLLLQGDGNSGFLRAAAGTPGNLNLGVGATNTLINFAATGNWSLGPLGVSTDFGVGYPLQVNQSINSTINLLVQNANAGATAAAQIVAASNSGNTQLTSVSTAFGAYGQLAFTQPTAYISANNAAGVLNFQINAANKMQLSNLGQLLIGTTSDTGANHPLQISVSAVGASLTAQIVNTDTTAGALAQFDAISGSINTVVRSSSNLGLGYFLVGSGGGWLGTTGAFTTSLVTNNTVKSYIDTNGNVVLGGTGAALAVGATNGFAYLATCAGLPTGIPASLPTGALPLVQNSTTGAIYTYLTPTAGTAKWMNPAGIIQQNVQSANYTLAISDIGGQVYTTTTGLTFTIPAQSVTNFPIGAAITIINISGANLLIAITTDELYLANSGLTGTRTLGGNGGIATVVKVASGLWLISGTGLT